MSDAPPLVIVLAGPNGAGKTTCARTLLAEKLQLLTFVNADVIAQGLSGFNPEGMAIQAGRVMLQRLRELAEQQASFAFESTLSGRNYARWLQTLRSSGYRIHLVYCWLNSAELAVARVAERVRRGGHNIPEETIRQRYERSMVNFFRLYQPLTHSWKVFDNSSRERLELIAFGDEIFREIVLNEDTLNKVKKGSKHAASLAPGD